MKEIGELYTLRGSIEASDANLNPLRLTLFDGKFDTGYKVVKFQIFNDGDTTTDVQGVLATSDNITPIVDWDFGDNQQIAWSQIHWWDFNISSRQDVVDPDNLIIEDLYLYATNNQRVNYIIQMQKYDISDWQGALGMVRNRSQA